MGALPQEIFWEDMTFTGILDDLLDFIDIFMLTMDIQDFNKLYSLTKQGVSSVTMMLHI